MRALMTMILRNVFCLGLLALFLYLLLARPNDALGQVRVPAADATAVVHIVVPGDSLYELARQYGTTVEAIVAANQLDDPNQLTVGQSLKIPNLVAATLPAETPAAASGATPSMSQRTYYACAPHASTAALALPAEAIRLLVAETHFYLIASGDLYQLPLLALAQNSNQEALLPENLIPDGRKVDGYTIQEFVDVTREAISGDLLLLDKTNDIYRYSRTNGWSMEVPATPIPGQFPDPQFLAIETIAGITYALDADLSHIWQLVPGTPTPRAYLSSPQLLYGTDMAVTEERSGPVFSILTYSGDILRLEAGRAARLDYTNNGPAAKAWPAQVIAYGDDIFVVDGDERSITALEAGGGTTRILFRIPAMRRLRSATIMSDTLYAVAGPTLLRVDLAATMRATACPTVTYDHTLYFEGFDIRQIAAGFVLPFPNAILPIRPRSYPGARRLYRYGIHRGVDLYGLDVAGLGFGSPVQAIGDGRVIRADNSYSEMSAVQYDSVMARTEAEHRTPPDIEDLFLGRQVRIAHEYNVESRYAHLSAIAPHITAATVVSQGTTVGRVGVSGTSAGVQGTTNDAHLHFEIWVNGRYLGHGLSLYETMRLWQAAFDDTAVAEVEVTASPSPTATLPTPILQPTLTPTLPPTRMATLLPTATPTPAITPVCQPPPNDYSRVAVNGELVNARTLWMLELASDLYTGRGDPLRVVQGSYSEEVAESFGTHAGGGVVDISIRVKADPSQVMSVEEAGDLVMALRQAGFAAWLRLPNDLVPETTLHIHAVAVGDRELSAAARRQLDGPEGYFYGLDGVPPEAGGPKPDRYGGPLLCDWMVELGFKDLR